MNLAIDLEVFQLNRDDILAKSRNENKNVLDEREKAVQTKANSISQGIGLILCIVIGAIGMGLTGAVSILWACTTIYWGMFAAERVAVAIKLRSKGQWIFAGVFVVGFVVLFAVFVVSCIKGWSVSL